MGNIYTKSTTALISPIFFEESSDFQVHLNLTKLHITTIVWIIKWWLEEANKKVVAIIASMLKVILKTIVILVF
jgi:uncharacterized membrane protein